MDALGLLGEGLLRPVDRLLQSAGAGRHRDVVEQRFERRPELLLGVMGVLLEHGVAGEGAETLRVDRVERDADDPAFRDEAGAHQVKEAGQQLLVGEIPGRAKQDDDLRQLGADPDRYFRHCLLHPRAYRDRAPRLVASGRQKRDRLDRPTSRRFHRRNLRLAQPSSSIRSARRNPCARQDASTPGTSARSRPETIASPVRADDRRERRREQPQGPRQDVGEDEVVRRASRRRAVLDPARDDRLAKGADAVQPRIGVGDLDRDGIDVAEPNLAAEQPWRRRWRARPRRSRRRARALAGGA